MLLLRIIFGCFNVASGNAAAKNIRDVINKDPKKRIPAQHLPCMRNEVEVQWNIFLLLLTGVYCIYAGWEKNLEKKHMKIHLRVEKLAVAAVSAGS